MRGRKPLTIGVVCLSAIAMATRGCNPPGEGGGPVFIAQMGDVDILADSMKMTYATAGTTASFSGIRVVPKEGKCLTHVCLKAFVDQDLDGEVDENERIAWSFCPDEIDREGDESVSIGDASISWGDYEPRPRLRLVVKVCCNEEWCAQEKPATPCQPEVITEVTALPSG